MATKKKQPTQKRGTQRTYDARPDTVDFRDKMYVPTLVEVPIAMPLERYVKQYAPKKPPILDQGQEGACTGFGLAAVANFLLHQRKVTPDPTLVSPRMIYDMARRYDEWPGEKYSGSSARGAMKGWHKHGVCTAASWPFKVGDDHGNLDHARALDAAKRPLGAYFRVNHLELPAMHSALAEVGILYATCDVHSGWDEVDKKTGVIPGPKGKSALDGHAFAIVGYDERGFWLQNSWGAGWGKQGFALISYDDWLEHASDVWVARLGAPTTFVSDDARAPQLAVASTRADFAFTDLRPHVVCIGNDGLLRPSGTFATTPRDLQTIFEQDFPRITQNWPVKRILLYAHGGLVSESAALQRVEDYRRQLLDAQVYPLAFVWRTDFLTTLENILKDAFSQRRPEGFLDSAKDFLLDRLDDTLEPLARPLGKALWDEMKKNAILATTNTSAAGPGGARQVQDHVDRLLTAFPKTEIHVAGHSAGSIFMAPLVHRLTGELKRTISSCSLWAPACTVELFKNCYLPAIRAAAVRRFALFTLKDKTEQDDDCANIYHKSLLYLVSNAFELHDGFFAAEGEPILGMQKFIFKDPTFKVNAKQVLAENPPTVPLFGLPNAAWVRSPNGLPEGGTDASHALHHGDFDDDTATVRATLARILNRASAPAQFDFRSSAAALRDSRRHLERHTHA